MTKGTRTKSATLAKAEKALRTAGMAFPEVTEDFPAYGLGRSGWVTARFQRSDKIPLVLLRTWIEESYQAVAPKKLAALLGGKPGHK